MQKLVIDTNIWIDWFRRGVHEELLLGQGAVKYLSSIVLMELYAGAHRSADQRRLDRFVRAFEGTRRIITPSMDNYRLAGQVLAMLSRRHGFEARKMTGLSHDVLIALTARSIGATVVTANRRDFVWIQDACSFDLQII